MAAGNLPQRTDREPTSEYFNNFFEQEFVTSQNVNDAVLGYFQTVTGDAASAKVLASTVLMTSLSQGIDPMSIIDELRRLSQKNQINEQKFWVMNKDGSGDKQTVVAANPTDAILKGGEQLGLTRKDSIDQLKAELSYNTRTNENVDPYAKPGPPPRKNFNELDAYLTVFLNLNRVGSSLLGISNQPQTNKYVQRAILP